eukprot:gene10711-12670_t
MKLFYLARLPKLFYLALLPVYLALQLYQCGPPSKIHEHEVSLRVHNTNGDAFLHLEDDVLASELSQAIQLKTVSSAEHSSHLSDESAEAFRKTHKLLRELYPRVHAEMSVRAFEEYSLLYELPGSNESLRPLLVMCHLDVVPVDPATAHDWEYPPFSGTIAEGYVWGRGALDMKHTCISLFHALEKLLSLRSGFTPQRTLLFQIGHDEEVGGHGAQAIVAYLRSRQVQLEMVVDEGLAVVEPGMIPVVSEAVALIGLAEKRVFSVTLSSTEGGGGHASTPELGGTPISNVAGAVAELSRKQLPPQTIPLLGEFIDAMVDQLTLLEHYNRTLAGMPVQFEETASFDASDDWGGHVSSTDTFGYRALQAVIKEVFGADMPVVPFLVLGATDS